MNVLISIVFASTLFGCASKPIKDVSKQGQDSSSENIVVKSELDSNELKIVYQNLTSSYGGIYEQEYFDAFPKSFSSFVEVFGNLSDSNDFKPAPLYNESHLYVQAFFNLESIDESNYLNRVIDICIEGDWDADAVNYFQHGTREKVKQSVERFSQLLSERNDKEIKSFWHFYFDEPHPFKEMPKELEQIKEFDKRIYSLMLPALEEVQQEWEKD